MEIRQNNMLIADYCAASARGEVIVNNDYQRRDKVWPPAAKSYLIETIILGLPLPKFYLYQISDAKSGKNFKEIVDGQQRTKAIREYQEDKFRLSKVLETESIAGKKYSQLDDDERGRFDTYSLSIDLFVAATREEVREVFRRMNSYTIPLNPEEHRHASYQGEFKWFITRLARHFSQSFVEMGVFREKQLIRMADTKLLTEICDAVFRGIQTTKKKALDDLYKDKDATFEDEDWLDESISAAIDQLISFEEIHRGNLVKPHIVYSMLLAFMHLASPLDELQEIVELDAPQSIDDEQATASLLALSEALEDPEGAGDLTPFVDACSSKTNVREQRETRFKWLCSALTESLG